ncbi:MAG: DUF1302 family protein [Gammaproteobacteria bacterium]|nr:DUF1302 family protein [Gammaproteobacteria bacterium]
MSSASAKGDYGFFARFRYLYDYTLNSRIATTALAAPPPAAWTVCPKVPRMPPTGDAARRFAYGSWTVADRQLAARIGKQVISWGESKASWWRHRHHAESRGCQWARDARFRSQAICCPRKRCGVL